MWNLKNKGLIDHLTVSFYFQSGDTNFEKANSLVKFGSMDMMGLSKDVKQDNGRSKLQIIKTKNKTTWDMDLEWVRIQLKIGQSQTLASDMTLRMEP